MFGLHLDPEGPHQSVDAAGSRGGVHGSRGDQQSVRRAATCSRDGRVDWNGFCLAQEFATHGFDVVMAADEARVRESARDIESLGAKVYPVQVDLSQAAEVEKLWREVEATGRPVDAIAINAGIGTAGEFADETDLQTELKLIDLNVRSTVHLAKLASRHMKARGSGRILITASIAGTMPTPQMAVYGASKAFDLEFAQSLRYELKDTGVTVTALKPGATDTEFFKRAEMEDTKVGSKGKESNDPADVAKQGFEALMAGEQEVFASSISTKATGVLGRFMPDSVKASQHEKMAKHGSGE